MTVKKLAETVKPWLEGRTSDTVKVHLRDYIICTKLGILPNRGVSVFSETRTVRQERG